MTVGQKFGGVNTILLSFFIPKNTKTPAITGAFPLSYSLIHMARRYSFKELGSDMFLGDFRLR
jgi:hypothetical protein